MEMNKQENILKSLNERINHQTRTIIQLREEKILLNNQLADVNKDNITLLAENNILKKKAVKLDLKIEPSEMLLFSVEGHIEAINFFNYIKKMVDKKEKYVVFNPSQVKVTLIKRKTFNNNMVKFK